MRMNAPHNCDSINIGNEIILVDEDGVAEIPNDRVEDAMSHGFTKEPPPARVKRAIPTQISIPASGAVVSDQLLAELTAKAATTASEVILPNKEVEEIKAVVEKKEPEVVKPNKAQVASFPNARKMATQKRGAK